MVTIYFLGFQGRQVHPNRSGLDLPLPRVALHLSPPSPSRHCQLGASRDRVEQGRRHPRNRCRLSHPRYPGFPRWIVSWNEGPYCKNQSLPKQKTSYTTMFMGEYLCILLISFLSNSIEDASRPQLSNLFERSGVHMTVTNGSKARSPSHNRL